MQVPEALFRRYPRRGRDTLWIAVVFRRFVMHAIGAPFVLPETYHHLAASLKNKKGFALRGISLPIFSPFFHKRRAL